MTCLQLRFGAGIFAPALQAQLTMGRLSLGNESLAVVVTSLDGFGTELPVKNTFIHFSAVNGQHRTGCVQRFRTDPSSEPRSRLPSNEDALDSLVLTSSSGCSTPQALAEDSCSSADSASADSMLSLPSEEADQVGQCEDWGDCVSTPVSFPHWAGVPAKESRFLMPISTWTATDPSQIRPPSTAKNSSSSPFVLLDDGSAFFGFTNRRADGVEWGLDVTRDEHHQALLVNGVLPGAIQSWNTQVLGGPKADRALLVGDFIVSINGKRGCQAMVDESNNTLWKVEVFRPKFNRTSHEVLS